MDTPHPQYTVTHQQVEHAPDESGQFVKHYRVHFESPEGTKDHVSLPESHYTAENVHALIQDRLQHIQAVHGLPGSLQGHREPARAA